MRQEYKVYVGVVLVFLLGVLIGALGTGIYSKKRMTLFTEHQPWARKAFMMKILAAELDLTPSQQGEIEKVVDTLLLELGEFRKKHQPELQEILAKHFVLVKDKLSTVQQQKLDKLQEKFQRWRSIKPVPQEMHEERRPRGLWHR
jgi:hypothetical protein